MFKLYCISVIQGSMTIYNPAMGYNYIYLKMTFLIGMMIFGNIVDNVSQPRLLAIVIEIGLAIIWIFVGADVYMIMNTELTKAEVVIYEDALMMGFFHNLEVAQFVASGIVIINILQISNWFTQKHINKMLALYCLS